MSPKITAWAAACVGICGVLASPSVGRAQDQSYNVDFFQGPVVSSNRVIGLGGAYIGVAEGADGHMVNPAAFGLRPLHARADREDDYDWDFAISWLNLRAHESNKLDGSKQDLEFDEARFLQGGLNFKFGRHAFGLHAQGQTYVLDVEDVNGAPRQAEYEQSLGGLGYAYTLPDEEWILGVMVLAANVQLTWADQDEAEAGITGGGLLLGALYLPRGEPWRLGAVMRTPILSNQPDDNGVDEGESGRLVPNALKVPGELGVGGSYVFGPRPYNPGPYLAPGYARRYLMLTADVVVTAPSTDAVGVASFLAQQPERSGKYFSLSVRAGAESEVIPDRLVVRAGTYHEPDRFASGFGRVHGTAGADVRVTWGWRWKVSSSIDVAQDWLNFGLGVGFWH